MKNNTFLEALGSFIIIMIMAVAMSFFKVFIILKLIVWFKVPIQLSFIEWFGLVAVFNLVSYYPVESKSDLSSGELTFKAFKDNLTLVFVYLLLLLIFYILKFFM